MTQPPSWTLSDAEGALRRFLKDSALTNADDLVSIRMGENAIFRDDEAGVIIRLGRSNRDLKSWQLQIKLVERLLGANASVNRPKSCYGLSNPFDVGGRPASSWEIVESVRAPTLSDLATALRSLHAVSPDVFVGECLLEDWHPFHRAQARLMQLQSDRLLDGSRAGVFLGLIEELKFPLTDWIEKQRSCVIHADAHLGNLVVADEGPVLLDTDTLCRGPELWDVVPTYVSTRRFGLTGQAWQGFLAEAGAPGASELVVPARLREIDMVLWLWQQRESGSEVDSELDLRYDSLHETGEVFTQWTAF